MSQDEEQLNLLSIFHYVVGGLTILFGSFFLIYIGLGVAMVVGALSDPKHPGPDPMGWMFIAIGFVAVMLGWTLGVLTVIAGTKLRRHTSRVFCIVIASIQCVNQPFGTILGVFTIIVLMRPSVIALFAGTSLPAAGSQSTL